MRAEVGFVTPFKPLERGEEICVSDRDDFVEFLMHPDDAFRYLIHGYPVGGVARQVLLVDAAPLLNALQVQVKNAEHRLPRERYGA